MQFAYSAVMGMVYVSLETSSKLTASSLKYCEMEFGHRDTVSVTSEFGSRTPDEGCTVNSFGFPSTVSGPRGCSSPTCSTSSSSGSSDSGWSSDCFSGPASLSKQTGGRLPSFGTCARKFSGTSLVLMTVNVLAEVNPKHAGIHHHMSSFARTIKQLNLSEFLKRL